MGYLFLGLSILLLIFGHFFKVYRQKQLIEIYEKGNDRILLRALSGGYVINSLLPSKIGDLFRAWYSGRHMKNGVAFSLATVIIDRVLDVIVVGILFILFYILGFKNKVMLQSIGFYSILSFSLIVIILFSLKHNKFLKKIVKKFASIFNSYIEYGILKAFWCVITSLKDVITNISKRKLIINTIIIWLFYLSSYYTFALAMTKFGFDVSALSLILGFFSRNSINIPTLNIVYFNNYLYSIYFMIYLFLPLILMFIISLIPFELRNSNDNYIDNKYLELIPHNNFQDKLLFLEAYFSAESRDYFQNYLQINRDICILKDYSAGSNATTMLCTDNKKTFFRKYSFGKDSEKLFEQVEWLKKYQKNINLPEVLNVKHGDGYCSYDMPYVNNSISFFDYIHSHPIEKSWKILEEVLKNLEKNLYAKNIKKIDLDLLNKYIDTKVIKNIEKIENGQFIKPILKYDYLIINGKKYKNFPLLKKYLKKEYLVKVFKNDNCGIIHGDLTVENIICFNDKDSYYLIDPNTGNVHESPNLDYAKLLQSLHGNYEFLMNTKNIEVYKNNINYLFTSSQNYKEIYLKYDKFLQSEFSKEKVKSIYFHEIIHWLRLLPYKIEKNKERSVLFYVGLIIVMNEIIEKYGE